MRPDRWWPCATAQQKMIRLTSDEMPWNLPDEGRRFLFFGGGVGGPRAAVSAGRVEWGGVHWRRMPGRARAALQSAAAAAPSKPPCRAHRTGRTGALSPRCPPPSWPPCFPARSCCLCFVFMCVVLGVGFRGFRVVVCGGLGEICGGGFGRFFVGCVCMGGGGQRLERRRQKERAPSLAHPPSPWRAGDT